MNSHPYFLISLFSLLVRLEAEQLAFTDITVSSGINYVQHGIANEPTISVYMSGGAAAGDYDRDGWTDIYVTRLDDSNILYRNQGDGTFEDVTDATLGEDHLKDSRSNGCAFADVDNDGDLDLYVTSINSTRYHLYINNGDDTFTEEGEPRGAAIVGADTHYGFSVCFADYDRDGYLDLHTTEWRLPDTLNPTGAPHNNRLLRNLGAASPGFFQDVTSASGVATDDIMASISGADSQGFTPRFTDIDQDQITDLLLAGDHQTSRLFWGNENGTFLDGTVLASVATEQFGMGSALGDYDGDGDLDWFVTSIFAENEEQRNGNRLFRNDGERSFTDVTDIAGVRDGGWGWAASFEDFDHDGDLDLIQTNGAFFPFAPSNTAGFEDDATRMFQNNGDETFTDVAGPSSGIVDNASGKALITLDFDNDGDLDVFITNNMGQPVFYENTGADGSDWLIVKLDGFHSNRQGIGTVVKLFLNEGDEPLVREITASSNFLGQSEVMAHFGLGDIGESRVQRVELKWPSGVVQILSDLEANMSYEISEPVNLPLSERLSILRTSSGEIELGWDTQVEVTYMLQRCENLALPLWTTIFQEEADSSTQQFTIPMSFVQENENCYYRVIRLD